MKFDEAIALADGNLLNEEVLNEILYNKYANALLTKKESVIRDQNRKIIEAEGKPNKMRSFPHGEKTADKSVTMPDAGGLIQFSEGVMNYLKSHWHKEITSLFQSCNTGPKRKDFESWTNRRW